MKFKILTFITKSVTVFVLIRSQGNKAYLLQMPSGKVPVYCHMASTKLEACGGGGWTLVMKIDGNKVSHDNRLSLCRKMYIILCTRKEAPNMSIVPFSNYEIFGSLSLTYSLTICSLKIVQNLLFPKPLVRKL